MDTRDAARGTALAASLSQAFLLIIAACRAGDVKWIEQLVAWDVEVYSDGGCKASAARAVIRGQNRTARFLAGVFRILSRDSEMQAATVNGEPGVAFVSGGAVVQIMSLGIGEGFGPWTQPATRTS